MLLGDWGWNLVDRMQGNLPPLLYYSSPEPWFLRRSSLIVYVIAKEGDAGYPVTGVSMSANPLMEIGGQELP